MKYQTPWDQICLQNENKNLTLGGGLISCGAYAMVYVGNHNNTHKKSVPADVLKATNEEEDFFMSLQSGKIRHSYIWEELPIYQDVIGIVEILAREGKQPVVDNNQPLFEWLPEKYIEDFQHDLIIQKEEGPYENQAHKN